MQELIWKFVLMGKFHGAIWLGGYGGHLGSRGKAPPPFPAENKFKHFWGLKTESPGGILTTLLKEIKHLIVIIYHFFFATIGFILNVFVQITMCFPCKFRFFSNFKL